MEMTLYATSGYPFVGEKLAFFSALAILKYCYWLSYSKLERISIVLAVLTFNMYFMVILR